MVMFNDISIAFSCSNRKKDQARVVCPNNPHRGEYLLIDHVLERRVHELVMQATFDFFLFLVNLFEIEFMHHLCGYGKPLFNKLR